jgi:hypothetical protein
MAALRLIGDERTREIILALAGAGLRERAVDALLSADASTTPSLVPN